MNTKKERAERLREVLAFGYVTTKQALLEAGFTVHQIDNYIKFGQLNTLTPGVYNTPGAMLSWEGVVASLEQLGFDVTVGGLSALEQSGHGHYLTSPEKQVLYLYASSRFPNWLKKTLPQLKIITRARTKLLSADDHIEDFFHDVSTYEHPSITFKASRPELAILEFLQGVPKQATLEHADLLMEGLTTLSPNRLKRVLVSCNNIKVKRLFFWLAHRHNHAWLKAVDYKNFDLGKGKRVIVSPGVLDKTFNITVAKDMHASSE